VAEAVYKTIAEGGVVDGEKVSLGVHNAIRMLRDLTDLRQEAGGVGHSESGGLGAEELGTKLSRRVRPLGYKEGHGHATSDPLVWAAYIHVGS
jgi:hypothetical protein